MVASLKDLKKAVKSVIEASKEERFKDISWNLTFQVTLDEFKTLSGDQLREKLSKIEELLGLFHEEHKGKLLLQVTQYDSKDQQLMARAQELYGPAK